MKLEEMILVIENRKGEETNYLFTLSEYMKTVGVLYDGHLGDISQAVEELYATQKDSSKWEGFYYSANKSLSARFCSGQDQLRGFLFGTFNEEINNKRDFRFDEERCPKECLEVLKAYGMGTDGHSKFNSLHYEKMQHTFQAGERVRNLNGMDYRILEVLSPKNLLLLTEKNGQLVVGVDTNFYKRTPKEACISTDSAIYGIEWGQGIYLGNKITEISFDAIRNQYGIPSEQKNLAQHHDEQKYRFDIYKNLSENKALTDEVRDAAGASLDSIFGTDNRDMFLSFLDRGYYDGGFRENREAEQEKSR